MDSEHKFEKEFENISGVNTESKDTFDYVSWNRDKKNQNPIFNNVTFDLWQCEGFDS
jgi:hypothetical protein